MIDILITSKTRIKLLMKFFLNSKTTSYLRDLAKEYGESTNAIRIELNRLEKAGLLQSRKEANKKLFQANTKHPLFSTIQELLHKHTGIYQVIEHVLQKIGGLDSAYVLGNFARGHDGKVVEFLLVGNNIDEKYLETLSHKAEKIIKRKINCTVIFPNQLPALKEKHPEALLVWKS